MKRKKLFRSNQSRLLSHERRKPVVRPQHLTPTQHTTLGPLLMTNSVDLKKCLHSTVWRRYSRISGRLGMEFSVKFVVDQELQISSIANAQWQELIQFWRRMIDKWDFWRFFKSSKSLRNTFRIKVANLFHSVPLSPNRRHKPNITSTAKTTKTWVNFFLSVTLYWKIHRCWKAVLAGFRVRVISLKMLTWTWNSSGLKTGWFVSYLSRTNSSKLRAMTGICSGQAAR